MDHPIIETTWKRAAPGNVYMPWQVRNKEHWYQNRWFNGAPVTEIGTQPQSCDWYWSPLSFDGDRHNQTATEPIRVLYADLDPVHPDSLAIRPTAAWLTSPDSYQALWYITPIGLGAFVRLNKALTYTIKADRSGWHPSKVLRVPGSLNWKRGGVRGHVLWFDPDRIYSATVLSQTLDEVAEGTLPDSDPKVVSLPTEEEALELEKGLPMGIRAALNQTVMDDRSQHIWRTAKLMKRFGISEDVAFKVIWYKPWNKMRKQHRPGRLKKDIARAYSS